MRPAMSWSFSELGKFDLYIESAKELAEVLRKRRAIVGGYSAEQTTEIFGERATFRVALWWRKGGSAEKYDGKIVAFIDRAKVKHAR